jgi:hypothetical protein
MGLPLRSFAPGAHRGTHHFNAKTTAKALPLPLARREAAALTSLRGRRPHLASGPHRTGFPPPPPVRAAQALLRPTRRICPGTRGVGAGVARL